MSDETPSELDSVLDQLASAKTPTELVKAHERATEAVRNRRRKAARQLGPLAQTYTAAMEQWDREKDDGVSKEDRIAHLETILRAAWPQTRAWHYLCEACRDTGLVIRVCRAGDRCSLVSMLDPSKLLCAQDPDTATHEYGVPCHVCEKGKRFRPKPKETPEDFSHAGRSKPMTKIGRR